MVEGLRDERGIHAETAVALLAGVLGHGLLMGYREHWASAETRFTAVFIEDVNQELLQVAQFLESILAERAGAVEVAPELPEEHAPREGALGLVARCHESVEAGLDQTGTEPGQRRWILAFAVAELLGMAAEALPPPVALRIALRSMVRAAKTPPKHLASLPR